MSEYWKKTIIVAKKITEAYAKHEHDDISIREAAFHRAQFPAVFEAIQETDLFAGRVSRLPLGYRQSYETGDMGYLCNSRFFEYAIENGLIPENLVDNAKSILKFWDGRTTVDFFKKLKTKIDPPPTQNALLPPEDGNDWQNRKFAMNYMYRFTEINLDFDKLLTLGIDGMIEFIRKHKSWAEDDKTENFYIALIDMMELLRECCLFFAEQADLMQSKADGQRAEELQRISADLRAVMARKPLHFSEAAGLFFLYSQMAFLDNFGRMDVYLGDFYAADIDSGYLSEAEAEKLVGGLLSLMNQIYPLSSGRFVIGGRGRRNTANADKFVLCALKVCKEMRLIIPQIAFRFDKNTDKKYMDAAMEAIYAGCTYPMLYNDDVIIPCVENSFDVSLEDAEQYITSNCGEIGIYHKSAASPSGAISYTKLLELTIHNGFDAMDNTRMLLQTGHLEDYKTFDELWAAFEKQVENALLIITENMTLLYDAIKAHSHNLFASALMDGCVEKGTGLIGGAEYLGFIIESHFMITAADSLFAIKKLVFDEKKISGKHMRHVLLNNFEGYALEHKMMLDVPKYGNDDDEADEMAAKVIKMIYNKTKAMAKNLPVDFCLGSHISVDAAVYLGKNTGATADGRRTGMPLSNSNNPTPGNDRNGITALLNSMMKIRPEPCAGQVNHLKITPDLIKNNKNEFETLIDTFFKSGGDYLCISVLSREQFLDAMKNPAENTHLMVRIGGYSARFVDLPRELQEEVIERTEY